MFRVFFISLFVMSSDLLMEFGQAPSLKSSSQQEFTLVTWNIYKGKKEGLYQDLKNIAQASDFVLLQEFSLNSSQQKLMASLPETHWAFAKSFEDSGGWTGVATMSSGRPLASIPVRSPGAEPLVGTPKMSLITKYSTNAGELWIVNLHGLNFDITHVDFEEQIDDVVARLQDHQGPLIFAGDFNTWSSSRMEYLMAKTHGLGLRRADLESPMGLFSATLDHIFYRGVQLVDWTVMEDVESSDHVPLKVKFTMD